MAIQHKAPDLLEPRSSRVGVVMGGAEKPSGEKELDRGRAMERETKTSIKNVANCSVQNNEITWYKQTNVRFCEYLFLDP